MASNLKVRVFAGVLLLALLGAVFWSLRRPATEAAKATQVLLEPAEAVSVGTVPELKPTAGQTAKTSSAEVVPASANVAAQVAPSVAPSGAPVVGLNASQPVPQNNEVRATRAMYMAHAPLRTPEVANPDSEPNRQILQAMVEKALTRQKPTP